MKQTVVITGASRGIGRAVALAFAEKSASVKIKKGGTTNEEKKRMVSFAGRSYGPWRTWRRNQRICG